jgi:hypothetical protein
LIKVLHSLLPTPTLLSPHIAPLGSFFTPPSFSSAFGNQALATAEQLPSHLISITRNRSCSSSTWA